MFRKINNVSLMRKLFILSDLTSQISCLHFNRMIVMIVPTIRSASGIAPA